MKIYPFLMVGILGCYTPNLFAKPYDKPRIEHHQIHKTPLLIVIQKVADKAGLKLVYDASLLAGRESSNLPISNNTQQDLTQLLKGTGIDFQIKNGTLVLHEISLTNPPKKTKQQALSLSGKVLDSRTGNAIKGATLRIHSKQTFQSDGSGSFQIPLTGNPDKVTLHVRTVGYKSREINLSAKEWNQPIIITLEEDLFGLDEIVVTGQGLDINKRRLSTNIASISAKELEKVPAGRLDQLLQAKLPNAQIRLTSGQAGSTSIIRARGVISAFKNSTPVIYVDGVRMDNLNTAAALAGGNAQSAGISSIADIPMDNIERIEYVNGGAATTLYGSDAANGVIQIFTKKGGHEKTTLQVESTAGVEQATSDFLHFERSKELLFQPGFFQRHHMALNGRSQKVGYSVTAGYLNSSGVQVFDQNRNKRLDLRTGIRADLHEKVSYESSFSFINNAYKRNRNGNQGGYTGLWFVESGASAVTGPQPRFNPRIDEQSPEEFARMLAYVHKAEQLQDNEIIVNRFQTSQNIQYKPLENLTFKAIGGIDYRVMRNQVIQTNEYLTHTTGTLTTNLGNISNAERKYWGLTLEFNGQHRADFGDFSLVSTMGGQLFRNEDRQIAYVGLNTRDGAKNIAEATSTTSNERYFDIVNYGLYAQTNLGWKNKLFMDLGLRGDANSAFGKDIGIQYYPKIGLSYIPSAEDWWATMVPFISSAKVRGNYGVAGNFPTAFVNLRTMALPSYLGNQATTFGMPGVDLRPEKTTTLETGLELGLWKDRLTFSAGYYHAKTNDALFNVPPAPSTAENISLRNVGTILNRGFEFASQLSAIHTETTTLRINLAINTLENKVLSSNGVAPFNIAGFSERTIQTVVQEGFPVGFIRGSYGEFGPDGVMSKTTPLQYLGTTIPDLFGNFGFDFQYKGLNLFANADYQKGAYANNWDSQFRYNYGAGNEGIPEGEINSPFKRTRWLQFTNMFIEKTDFIKVRTIGATYTLPKSYLPKTIQQGVIGASVMNPLNFASSSFDPEATISGAAAGQDGATTGGISYATYSAPRQYLMSLKLSF